MIVQPLRQQLIPDVIALMELGGPYLTARTHTDYWLYATLFSTTCPVALIDDRLAGVAIGFRSQDTPEDLYVQDLLTHPDYRRRGVVRALLNALCERARAMGCRRVYLTSTPDNHVAHRAWAALGFTNVPGDDTVGGVSVITDLKGPGKTRAVFELRLVPSPET